MRGTFDEEYGGAAATDVEPAVDTPEPPAAADPGVDLEVDDQVFADEAEVEEPLAEAVEPEPAPTRAPVAVTTPETSPSIVSRIVDIVSRPFVLIGVGVGVLLLAALLFLRRKRDDDIEDVTGRWEALEAEVEAEDEEIAATSRLRKEAELDDFVVVEGDREESDATADSMLGGSEVDEFDDFARTAPPTALPEDSEETLSSQTVINLDQADPIAEADFHMAYGLYDQAAELVSKALETQPGNRNLKLKLLEVFFVWGNKEAFLDAAQALRDEMGDQPDGDWDKVIIMGKQICPDEPLFADATAAAGEVDLDLEAGDSEPALDLAFDDPSISDDDTGTHAAAGDGLDLDFGGEADFGSDDLVLESTGERTASTEREESSDDLDDGLDIGERTSAGLEAALFGIGAEDEDNVTATTPDVDVDSLAATQESPTVERTSLDDEDWSGVTMESPTVDAMGPEGDTIEVSPVADEDDDYDAQNAPTMESPTLESAAFDSPTLESATVDSPTVESEAAELPTVEQTGLHSSADRTAELDLDDLGLDVEDLQDLPTDLGDLPSADDATGDTREQPALNLGSDDDDLLSATGVTQVLRGDEEGLESLNTAELSDDDVTMMAPGLGDDSMSSKTLASTEVLQPVPEEAHAEDSSVDLNLDDLSSALEGGDTVEQPRASSFGGDVFGGSGHTPVDLDVGDDVLGNDDPTGTEEVNLDPQTMTEVGTKLDLARAYIDMGDPEGARSILEEVLDEGDSGQKREAQTLIEVLSA
jgi:pilus assembly protein FimV